MDSEIADLPDSADSAAALLNRLDDTAWAVAAFVYLASAGLLEQGSVSPTDAEHRAAAETLAAAGLAARRGGDFVLAPGLAALARDGTLETRVQGMVSSLRQLATAVGIIERSDGDGWAAQDDVTLLTQGRSSALGGTMLASYAVPSLDGLDLRFADGGEFLDVGVGVGEMTAAFCDAIASACVVGIDVLPRALDLARRTVKTRGLHARVELRLQGVQELEDSERFDLAWLPAPFIPQSVFAVGVGRIHQALRPGGWLIVGAGRFDGEPLAVAVTRWKTLRAGGTPLTATDARTILNDAQFASFRELPTPPGAPNLYAAQRRQHGT
jgi:SAM-dependent methyltransferase